MNEKLFQFIWQQGRFNQANLKTLSCERLFIIDRGVLNADQGPDFLNARIRINETVWAGSVELHLRETDWYKHRHNGDPNYENVILHVVFSADGNEASRTIPTLCLEGRIAHTLLSRHEQLFAAATELPCRNLLYGLDERIFFASNEKTLQERWQRKYNRILKNLEECKYHFEEVLWRLLAANFGSPVNAGSFEIIARSVPWGVVQKIRLKPHALEALLLGQGGLLSKKFREKYPCMRKREFESTSSKYKLERPQAPLHFLRMRPANFPTIRLVQLADLFIKQAHLFAKLRDANNCHELMNLLNVHAGDYWDFHYRPDEEAVYKKKVLGGEMKRNILINTFLPFLYSYGCYVQSEELKEKAKNWLRELPAEDNRLTRQFTGTPFPLNNAFDSQALIHLVKDYCNEKKCLECMIGSRILQ